VRVLALLAATALLAAGCARTELRYEPAGAPAPLALAPVGAVSVSDASGGFRSEGAGLSLTRPFFDIFRDAVAARLGALKVATGAKDGAPLGFDLKQASIERGSGFGALLTANVKYTLTAGGPAPCRQEVVGWAQTKEGFASSPAAATMRRALDRAMENLAPALSACLGTGTPAESAAGVPSAARDVRNWALIAAVGRSREAGAGSPSAAKDAAAAAAYAKTALGVPDGQVVVIVDEMATLADLRKHLAHWVPEHVGPDGKVFIALFGRGTPKPAAYFLPYDGDASAPEETGLKLADVYAQFGKLPGRAEVVLGADVGAARPAALPKNVQVFPAEADPSGAFQQAGADWGGR
jgi:hypothetical protein